jgi:hypothetical protein
MIPGPRPLDGETAEPTREPAGLSNSVAAGSGRVATVIAAVSSA